MTFAFPQTPAPDPRLIERGHDLLPEGLGATLDAVMGDATLRPTELFFDQRRLDTLGGRSPARGLARPDTVRPFEADIDPGLREFARPSDPEDVVRLTPFVSPERLKEQYGHLGLTFDRPMRRAEAEALAEIKREERIRADIVARGPSGVLATGAKFGAALLGAAIDPVNIAAAFVPVVGPARFAMWAERSGVTAARFGRGAVEGFAGAAAVEPLVAGLAMGQQRDYTMADALLNVALGTALGGGLHVGGGRIADFVAARSPGTREAALRAAVAQTATGRNVEVEAILRAERAHSPAARILEDDIFDAARFNDLSARFADAARAGAAEAASAGPGRVGSAPDVLTFLRGLGGVRDEGGELRARDLGKARPGTVSRAGRSLDEAALLAWEAGYFPNTRPGFGERPSVADLLELIDRNLRGERVVVPEDEALIAERAGGRTSEASRLEDMERADLEATAAALDMDVPRGTDDAALRAMVDAELDERTALMTEAGGPEPTREQVIAAARGADAPEADALAGGRDAEIAHDELAALAREIDPDFDYLAGLTDDVAALRAETEALGVEVPTATFDALDTQTRELTAAARAGAACLAREG